jgi:hypothetical protein
MNLTITWLKASVLQVVTLTANPHVWPPLLNQLCTLSANSKLLPQVNFGDVKIPKNLDYPRPQKIDPLNGVHLVSSDAIVVVDAQTLLVPNFSYDGEAPGKTLHCSTHLSRRIPTEATSNKRQTLRYRIALTSHRSNQFLVRENVDGFSTHCTPAHCITRAKLTFCWSPTALSLSTVCVALHEVVHWRYRSCVNTCRCVPAGNVHRKTPVACC